MVRVVLLTIYHKVHSVERAVQMAGRRRGNTILHSGYGSTHLFPAPRNQCRLSCDVSDP